MSTKERYNVDADTDQSPGAAILGIEDSEIMTVLQMAMMGNPLKIAGSDGAPARAILIDQNDKQTEKTQGLWR